MGNASPLPFFIFHPSRSSPVHWPRFPVEGENFGNLHTFSAVVGSLLIFACILRTSSPKMGGFGEKNGGRGGTVFTPNELVYTLGGYEWCLCQFWWKPIKKCERESAHRRTRKEANWFYNLSHAICYSCETDKKLLFVHMQCYCSLFFTWLNYVSYIIGVIIVYLSLSLQCIDATAWVRRVFGL